MQVSESQARKTTVKMVDLYSYACSVREAYNNPKELVDHLADISGLSTRQVQVALFAVDIAIENYNK